MTLSDLGNVGEFVGSVGVIVSLIYVGVQLKMTRQSERATAAWQSEKTWGDLSWELAEDPNLGEIVAKLLSGEEISKQERLTATFFVRALMQHAQSQFYLNKEGIMPDEMWHRRLNWLRQFVSIPTIKLIADAERAQGIIGEEFWAQISAREERFSIAVGNIKQ